jgi:hypothetical protein
MKTKHEKLKDERDKLAQSDNPDFTEYNRISEESVKTQLEELRDEYKEKIKGYDEKYSNLNANTVFGAVKQSQYIEFVDFVDKLTALIESGGEEVYKFSNDYDLMYFYLLQGNEIICYVNYQYSKSDTVMRDICRCKKFKDYDIKFLARGIQYGDVSDYFKDKHTEKELFIIECERMNLEWIALYVPPRIDFDKKPTDEEIKCPKCGCNKFAKVDDEYWCLNVNCKHEWLRDKQ